MAVRKKQDDKYLLALRELVNSGAGNRQCFDCNQKGPTYVNMTIGSFVCTRCSGVLRGLTPPHRVKSISMATFTQDELDFLKAHGNELCAKTWLGLWDPKRAAAQQDQRELMIDKYERKRYYLEPASPLKSLNLKSSSASNGYHTGNISSNGYASIHLTPPAAQRTAANGLSKSGANSTAISRPQHHHHQNHNHTHNQQQPQLNGNHDAFSHNLAGIGLGLTSLNSAGSTSTGALSDTSSCASNGFAGETDFVADFGSANIFDATSARSTGSPAVSSASSVSSTNGYAKVQPIRAAHLQQQQQQMPNGNSNGSENFADFEHAPIYNGVADGTSLQSQQQKQTTNKPSPRAGNAPSEDRYAALKDLDEQLRELKATEAATVTEAPTPTNGNTQLADAFGTVNGNSSNNNNNNNHANPFKSQQSLLINGSSHLVNPFQAQQLQQQQLQQQNLYGQLTLIPNGYGSSPQQAAAAAAAAAAATSFYNFNNNGFALAQGLPNGCGFGSMQPAPVLAGGLAGGFNNPFAASGAMNTNNPFL
ncbi:arf-GAP domain and FG repeat-containing protein 1 isoform X3 [Drosophila hydei]|uniref:Arf-GAP domain and FG repeat-containing protein 1 isoform X3 n=1 Tax=Drosophila hydei TaxID=7224 RepID=A0A6J1M1Q5_DROHY|nr:arf-GAP domain and FG repeat-containing protein 1 isoform X3 [Drosophila hydei]